MKIGISLLVRDEIDIITQWLDYHLPKVDLLVVTDNGSVDGTREILQKYKDENKNKIILIDEPEQNYMQHLWVDKMIKICIEEGCDWIVNSDADEIWNCSFRKLIEGVDENVNSICVRCRLYVPTVDDDEEIKCPIERMKYWVKEGRNQEESQCIAAWHKLIIKASDYKNIELGNHKAYFNKPVKQIIPDTEENYIKHYPNRCWSQYRSKYINGGESYNKCPLPKEYGWHWRVRYNVYYTQGIVGLKRLWYSEIEHDLKKLEKDN